MYLDEMCNPGILYGRSLYDTLNTFLTFDTMDCTGDGTVNLTSLGITGGIY